MLKQMRAVETDQETASTPDLWADMFASSPILTDARTRRKRRSSEWPLVERYIPPGSHVVDAGCGFGEWVRVLESAGYKASGVDYSERLIGRLRQAYPAGTWIHSDIRRIPLSDGSVDAVVSWGVIEHEEAGPNAALREFHRIVRPGGTVIVSVPQDTEAQRRAGEVLFERAPKMAFFQYAMKQEELNDFVRNAGFDVIEDGTLPGATFALMAPRTCVRIRALGRVGSVLERIGSALATPFSRYHMMVYAVGRKRA